MDVQVLKMERVSLSLNVTSFYIIVVYLITIVTPTHGSLVVYW